MEMSKVVSYSIIALFLIDYLICNFIYKNVDKPGFLKIKRAISLLVIITSIAYLMGTLPHIRNFIDSLVYHSTTGWDIYSIILKLAVVAGLTYICLNDHLYYLRHDDKTIMTGWYVRRHSEVLKKKQFDLSCHYLLKALALNPDSVIILCLLASQYEVFMKNPDQADRYLEQAGKVLKNTPQPAVHDQAILESYTGYILQHRGNTQQAIEHFQKAYDLDPQPFRKNNLDNARNLRIADKS
ncbi:MAG: hypothetical protein ABFD91_14645 [Anaerohalosphaeraceae bacterium]